MAPFCDTYTLTGSHPLVHHTLYFYSITMDDSLVLYDGGDMCHAQSGPLPQAPPGFCSAREIPFVYSATEVSLHVPMSHSDVG